MLRTAASGRSRPLRRVSICSVIHYETGLLKSVAGSCKRDANDADEPSILCSVGQADAVRQGPGTTFNGPELHISTSPRVITFASRARPMSARGHKLTLSVGLSSSAKWARRRHLPLRYHRASCSVLGHLARKRIGPGIPRAPQPYFFRLFYSLRRSRRCSLAYSSSSDTPNSNSMMPKKTSRDDSTRARLLYGIISP